MRLDDMNSIIIVMRAEDYFRQIPIMGKGTLWVMAMVFNVPFNDNGNNSHKKHCVKLKTLINANQQVHFINLQENQCKILCICNKICPCAIV